MPIGTILPYVGDLNKIPHGWVLCDGNNGTPDLRDRFIVVAGNLYTIGNIGGENFHQLTVNEMPSHNHLSTLLNDSIFGWDTNNDNTGSAGAPLRVDMGDNPGFSSYEYKSYTSYSGGNNLHENRPPFLAVYYIMRII